MSGCTAQPYFAPCNYLNYDAILRDLNSIVPTNTNDRLPGISESSLFDVNFQQYEAISYGCQLKYNNSEDDVEKLSNNSQRDEFYKLIWKPENFFDLEISTISRSSDGSMSEIYSEEWESSEEDMDYDLFFKECEEVLKPLFKSSAIERKAPADRPNIETSDYAKQYLNYIIHAYNLDEEASEKPPINLAQNTLKIPQTDHENATNLLEMFDLGVVHEKNFENCDQNELDEDLNKYFQSENTSDNQTYFM